MHRNWICERVNYNFLEWGKTYWENDKDYQVLEDACSVVDPGVVQTWIVLLKEKRSCSYSCTMCSCMQWQWLSQKKINKQTNKQVKYNFWSARHPKKLWKGSTSHIRKQRVHFQIYWLGSGWGLTWMEQH